MTLEELRAIRAGMTPGPWETSEFLAPKEHKTRVTFPNHAGQPGEPIAEAFFNWDETGIPKSERISWKRAENNARAIAALPVILDMLIENMEITESFLTFTECDAPDQNAVIGEGLERMEGRE